MIPYILLGGVAGTLARFGLQGWVQQRAGSGFPVGTLAVNLAGSFVLGFLMRYATGSTALSADLRAGLTIGFCGAFTTMSTFAYEGVQQLAVGEYGRFALYAALSVGGCIAAVVAGTVLANRLL